MIVIRGDETLSNEQLYFAKHKIKGVIYARVSSDDQIDNYSLESQVDLCVEYSSIKLGISNDELIAFIELGESGDNPDRIALNNMLEFISNEEMVSMESVIVYDADRLARDNFLQRLILNTILDAGHQLKMVKDESFNPFDENSMLQFNIKGVMAEFMKKKILSETRRGRMTKVKKHKKMMGIRQIYAYTFDKEEDILVENEEEKKYYLMMVDMLLEKNYSTSRIAKELSTMGVPAPRGNTWHQATVLRILRNEAYTGRFYYGKTEIIQIGGKKKKLNKPREQWIEIPIPSYIDDATFERILNKLDKNKRSDSGRPSENLLKGICRCGRCNASVHLGTSSVGKNYQYKYYMCTNKNRPSYMGGERLKKCDMNNWRQDIIDELVWEKLIEKLRNPEKIIESILKQQGDIQKAGNLFKKRQDIENKIEEQDVIKDRYFDLYAMGKIKNQADLDKKLEPIEEKIDQLKNEKYLIDEQLKYITSNHDELDMLKRKLDEFKDIIDTDDITVEGKQELVKIFVKKVVLHEKEVELHTTWSSGLDVQVGENDKFKATKLIPSPKRKYEFYVKELIPIPAYEKDYDYAWRQYADKLDKLVKMYSEDLKSIPQIAKETGIEKWIIDDLFEEFKVEKIGIDGRAKIKRQKDFDTIYNLHIVQKLSLNEIYRQYGYSPIYTKKVLAEKGYEHLGYVNQLK